MKYFSWQLLLSAKSISSAGLNEFWYIWLILYVTTRSLFPMIGPYILLKPKHCLNLNI